MADDDAEVTRDDVPLFAEWLDTLDLAERLSQSPHETAEAFLRLLPDLIKQFPDDAPAFKELQKVASDLLFSQPPPRSSPGPL